MNEDDDFFIPVSKNAGTPTSIKISDLKKLRADTFDRWVWDTGSDEDKALFEKLDKILESLKNTMDAGMFYCPYVPIVTINVIDNDDET